MRQHQAGAGAQPPTPPTPGTNNASGFDPQVYQEALRQTSPSTFARTAAAYAASPSLGLLRNPTVIDCILTDHAHTLTLFSHFFQVGLGLWCLLYMALWIILI